MRRAALGLLTASLLIAGYFGVLLFSGNFHAVVAGEFYRAAQPSPQSLEGYVRRFQIKSVINLRGANQGKSWYDDEVTRSNAINVQHYNFAMSSRRVLTRSEAGQLIALMAAVPKPVLVHCSYGADRSGLAAALYLARVKNADEDTAEYQLSPVFGHLSVPFLSSYAINDSWEQLEPWLGYPHS